MTVLKRHILKISLLLVLLSATFLCVHALRNYQGSTAIFQNITRSRDYLSGERNRPEAPDQMPGGRFQDTRPAQTVVPAGGRMPGGFTSQATRYAPHLVTYSAGFLVLCAAAYFLLKRKKINIHPGDERILIVALLCTGLLLKNLKNTIKVTVFALSTAAIIVIPFSLNKDALWIFRLFSNTLAEYPYASVNAFNFFSLLGANYTKDAATMFVFSYHTWGMIFIVVITAFAWLIYIKGDSRAFAAPAAFLLIAGVFTFSTRIHERYLFPAVALSILAFIYLRDKRLLLLSAGFSSTVYINTHFVLYWTGRGLSSAPPGPALIFTSLLNVILFIYLVKILYDIAVKKRLSAF